MRTSPEGERDLVEGDVLVTDDAGRPLVSVTGFRLRRLASDLPEVVERKARRLLYGTHWQELEALTTPAPEAGGEPGNWLVVSDSPAGSRLCALLAERGGQAVLVRPGDGYRWIDAEHRVLDPGSEDDWRKLIKEQIGAGAWPPRAVVHLSATGTAGTGTGSASGDGSGAGVEDGAVDGCFGVLNLVKALAADGAQPAPRLWLVTSAAQAPEGTEDVDPGQTAVWGLGRVVPYEHPELRCSLVDLPADPDLAVLRACVTRS
ncbi:KR prefix domain-containing protein [Planomonospora algeriensis]